MDNGLINIKKDLVKRKKFLKNEIKKIILKSILKSQETNPIIRSKARFQLDIFSRNTSISKQKSNICLKTGRIGGVFGKFTYSRHFIKKLGLNNNLQNFKIQGW